MPLRASDLAIARRWIKASAATIGFGLLVVAARGGDAALGGPAPAVYPIEVGSETRFTSTKSPHSALSAESALLAARTIAAQIKGAEVRTVMPTGSMRPIFDQRAFIVVEPTPFDDLAVGDIITYVHPRLQMPIVHRILEKTNRGYWTKGDSNSRPDDVYVTPANYLKRVVAIIYAREDSRLASASVSAGVPVRKN